MPGRPEKPRSDQVNSQMLYAVQRRAERPTVLFYLLVGLASASRKTLLKLASECSSDLEEPAHPSSQDLIGQADDEIEV